MAGIDPAVAAAIGAGGAVVGATLGSAAKGIADYLLARNAQGLELRQAARLIHFEVFRMKVAMVTINERRPATLPPPHWAVHTDAWEQYRSTLAIADRSVWHTVSVAYGIVLVLTNTKSDAASDLYTKAIGVLDAALKSLDPLLR